MKICKMSRILLSAIRLFIRNTDITALTITMRRTRMETGFISEISIPSDNSPTRVYKKSTANRIDSHEETL